MNTGGKQVKAAVYLRQSIDRDGDELAVSRQREDCVKLCAERGWRFAEYVDNDTSASTGRRTQYEAMLADIRAGEIGAVVAWDLDRLHRRPIELEHFIALADEKKLKLATVTGETDLSTDNGRLYARIKGAVARSEVERKTERQRRAFQQRAERGAVWSPVRLFGYTKPDKHGLGMEIVEEEAELLRAAYSGVLSGRSLMGIAREWNDRGIRTVRGNEWVSTVLRDMLLNPRNAGIRTYRQEEVGKGDWPAIVDEDVFRGVVAILRDPARTRRPINGYGRSHLLTGLVQCGRCGESRVTGTISNNTKTARAKYVCRACGGVARSAPDVDAWVVGHVVDYLSRPETIGVLVASDRPELADLRLKKTALMERKAGLKALLTDPDIPLAEVKAAAAEIQAKIAEINAKLSDANNVRVFDGVFPAEDDQDEFYALPEEERLALAQERFDALPFDRKRAVIDKLVTVRILPGQGSRQAFRTELVPVEPKLHDLTRNTK